MVGAYVCRRKLLLLATLITLHVVAWTGIIYTIQYSKATGYRNRSLRAKRIPIANYFESYANYSGPVPVPGPIELPPTLGFVLNEPDTCGAKRNPGLRVLCYVHSAPHHFQHREAIRRTWASPRFYSRSKMATVFFLGRTGNATLQAELEEESARFQDIVQADFTDDYYNLTYKAAFALAWITQFCHQVEYVLKTDDDVFVNTFRLATVLFENSTRDNAIHCHAYYSAAPFRSAKNKWRVSVEEYPWRKYPDFCAGLMFYFGGHLVPRLLAAMSDVPFVKIDDVYVTGMLRSHAGIGLHHMDSEVNVFSGTACLERSPTPEVSCLLNSLKAGEELWMQAMMLEIKARASKDEAQRTKYLTTFENILSGDR